MNQKTIQFSGYAWAVKTGNAKGPGPNNWSDEKAWVDDKGRLHLKLSKRNNKWYCAEVETTETFLHGTFEFKIEGRIDELDKNVVFACFTYPGSGLDHHHEMDMEFTRWGNATNNNLYCTVYPSQQGSRCTRKTTFKLNGSYSTHQFTWKPSSVNFKSFHGFNNNDGNLIYTASCTDASIISNRKMPVLINLWLYNGAAPSNDKEVEVIIHSFKHTPL